MATLLNFFYQLPLDFIAKSFLMLSLVYLCFRQRFVHCRWFRRGIRIMLALWIAAVFWITIFQRPPGAVHPPELLPFHSYRKLFETGNKEILRTNFMNVALFFPAGLLSASLFPEAWPRSRKLLYTGLVFALFSLAVEYVQFFFALGKPEIDDILHNTLGTMLGAIPIVVQDLLHAPSG